MRLPGAIRKSLRRSARNASLIGVVALASLLYLLITSRWVPSAALVDLWWPFEVVGWLAALAALALTWDSVRAVFQPQLHGAITRLRDHGFSDEKAGGLVTEVASGERERYGCATFLPSFVIIERWASYAILPIDWIVWAYAKETEHRKYGIHVRSSYEVFLALRNGERYSFSSSSSDHENQLLCCKQRNLDNLLVGYDEALDEAWSEDADLVIRDIDALAYFGKLESGPAAVHGAALRMKAGFAVDESRATVAAAEALLEQARARLPQGADDHPPRETR